MPNKPKKQKQTYPEKQPTTTSPRPWPDFPKKLLNTIGKQSILMKNISFGGATKSYRVPIKNCNSTKKPELPQLFENSKLENYQENTPRFDIFNISFHYRFYWWFCSRGPHPSKDPFLHFVGHVVGLSHGLVIVRSVDKLSEYYIRDPFRWSTRYLPNWDSNIPFKQASLSSDPDNHGYSVMLAITGIQNPAFVFCEFKGGKYEWMQNNSEIMDPYASPKKQLMQFTSVIGYKGKFYALSLQGTLAVIEVIDSQLEITWLGSSRAIPKSPLKHFKEYLIESEGEILLIFLISRKLFNAVDDVEIYYLEFERCSWVKMEWIGDTTLFVGENCCIFVNSSKVGCKGNCVYFTHQNNEDNWWVYDMKERNILPGWLPADSSKKTPVWDQPIVEE